ncbi:hypothetical protein D3C81_1355680 [compost metagenome]
MHACPLFMKPASRASGTAWSKSASSSTTTGDLPPSSSVTRFSVSAATRRMVLPTAVEPVNDTLFTSGCVVISVPTTSPRPVTILNTPGGTSAACSASVTMRVCIALISLGLMTAVQPAATAAASFPQIKPASLFQGVINPATPIGCITTSAPPTRRLNV